MRRRSLLPAAMLALVACDANTPAPHATSAAPPSNTSAATATLPSSAIRVGSVTVSLEKVAITRWPDDVHFGCDVVLFNDTGAPLQVLSNFSSAFDGLTLVVSAGGREVVRQAYIYHQSPYAQDERYELPPGRTAKTIVFPIRIRPPLPGGGLEAGSGPVSVQIVGGLRGTLFESGLASNVVAASL